MPMVSRVPVLLLAIAIQGCAHRAPFDPSVQPVVDSLYHAGMAQAAAGDTTAALNTLQEASKLAPQNADILYWRAVILGHTTSLSVEDIPRNILAWRLLERAEGLDRGNARYAIEMGRVRLASPLLRIEAERHFRRALRIAQASGDPLNIAEAAYEIGMIKQRRYSTVRNRYMSNPGQIFDPMMASSRLHYVREYLEQHSHPIDGIGSVERSEAEELFRMALNAVPTHERTAVALLSVLFDQGRFNEMISTVQPFIDANTGSSRIRLAAGLAWYKLGRNTEADSSFKKALELMSPQDREDMESLSRIIRRREAIAYQVLGDSARMHTDSAYWESADPLLSTPENEAWLEFMARNAYSDLYWTDSDMRQTGWRTDRGLIVLRYGEPPVIATFTPENTADAGDAVGRVLTVWRWPVEDMHYVFTGPPAMNVASFAGNFRSLAEDNREDVPFSLRNLAAATNVDSIRMQLARFRAANPNAIRLVVAAAADPSRLYRNAEVADGTLTWSLRMGEPSRLKLLNSDTMQVKLPAPAEASQTWIRDIAPGRYRVRVEALDANIVAAAGRSQDEMEARIFVPGALMLSDILIGYRMNPPEGPISGLSEIALRPRGNLTMQQREQFTMYWENYGLVPDSTGHVNFDVSVVIRLLEIDRSNTGQVGLLLGAISDAVGISPLGDQALGMSYEREELLGSRDRVPQVLNIGLGSSPAGTYQIELTVVDKNTKSTHKVNRIFYLARK